MMMEGCIIDEKENNFLVVLIYFEDGLYVLVCNDLMIG